MWAFSDVYPNLDLAHSIDAKLTIAWWSTKTQWPSDHFLIQKWHFGTWHCNMHVLGKFISVSIDQQRIFSCVYSSTINECANASLSLMFQISSSQCTKQQCGSYGVCRIMTSQQNVFSTCSCLAGELKTRNSLVSLDKQVETLTHYFS